MAWCGRPTNPRPNGLDLGAAVEGWREHAGDLPEASTDSGLDVAPLYTPLDAPEETYAERLGVPGEYPYTRGIYPAMYRERLWTMRLYSGWGGPRTPTSGFATS